MGVPVPYWVVELLIFRCYKILLYQVSTSNEHTVPYKEYQIPASIKISSTRECCTNQDVPAAVPARIVAVTIINLYIRTYEVYGTVKFNSLNIPIFQYLFSSLKLLPCCSFFPVCKIFRVASLSINEHSYRRDRPILR